MHNFNGQLCLNFNVQIASHHQVVTKVFFHS